MYTLGGRLGQATVEPGTNLLVTGPPLTGKRALARAIIERGVDDGEAGIAISTRDSADEIRSLLDCDGDRVGVVDCVAEHAGRAPDETDTVKYASGPTALTDVGVKFASLLEHFHCEEGVRSNRVAVDSVTTLLECATLQTVFRFLHATTTQTAEVDGLGVHVVESTVHDQQTMRTVRSLYDGVVETDVDGGLSADLPGDAGATLVES